MLRIAYITVMVYLFLLFSCKEGIKKNSIYCNEINTIDSMAIPLKNNHPEDSNRIEVLKKLTKLYFSENSTYREINKIESIFIAQSHYYGILSFNEYEIWFYKTYIPNILKDTSVIKRIKACRMLTILSFKSGYIDTRYQRLTVNILSGIRKSFKYKYSLFIFDNKFNYNIIPDFKKYNTEYLNDNYILAILNIENSNCINFIEKYQFYCLRLGSCPHEPIKR